jgi:CHASE2 domain-containing sensor protein
MPDTLVQHEIRRSLRRNLLRNVILGLAISILLWRFQDTGLISEIEDFSIDWISRLQQLQVVSESVRPLAVLVIDEETWEQWGNPAYTPREHLLEIMRYVTDTKAESIVVDIDLSIAGIDPNDELRSFLEEYDRSPRLLLVKRILPNGYPATSVYDAVVEANRNVFWVSTTYEVDEELHVRVADLYHRFPSGEAILSPQLLIANGYVTDVDNHASRQRVFYKLPWQNPKNMSPPRIDYHGTTMPLVERRSTSPLFGSTTAPDKSWLARRIVIIGSSSNPTEDRYITALGTMPGFYIIVNAIHSFLEIGDISQPPLWITLLIEMIVIALMSYAFARFSSLPGMLLSASFVLLAIIPVCVILLRQGVWFNLVIPVLTVQMMHFIFRLEEQLKPDGRPD